MYMHMYMYRRPSEKQSYPASAIRCSDLEYSLLE